MWGTYVDYWHYTRDDTYVKRTTDAMIFQAEPPKNAFMPGNWTASLGNDDQAFWGMAAMLRDFRPEIVINCAADTDVEGAESDPARCVAANALLPELLAQFGRDTGARLVHFSSTGCYGGDRTTPHGDYEPLRPSTVHHRAKAAGEAAVREAGGRHLILRLGWLYGGAAGQRKNFVWNRIVEAQGSAEIGSDPYQTGSPTFVGDVVSQTLALLKAELA